MTLDQDPAMIRHLLALAAIALVAISARGDEPPRVVRENIEWLDVWVPGNAVTIRPMRAGR